MQKDQKIVHKIFWITLFDERIQSSSLVLLWTCCPAYTCAWKYHLPISTTYFFYIHKVWLNLNGSDRSCCFVRLSLCGWLVGISKSEEFWFRGFGWISPRYGIWDQRFSSSCISRFEHNVPLAWACFELFFLMILQGSAWTSW